MLPVVLLIVLIVYQTARMGAPRGLGRPNCSGLPSPADPLLPGQTDSKLFEALFVVLGALLFVDFLSSSFDIVFYLLSEPLGVDFELPNWPSDPQKC